MTLPKGLDTLVLFINGHSDISALFSVIRVFSAKYQHLILNYFPLTIPVLQPSACHSNSVIYKEALLTHYLPTSKEKRTFTIHCSAFSLPRYILVLQTQKQLIDLRVSKSHRQRNKSIMGSTWLCQISLTDFEARDSNWLALFMH